MTGPGSSRCSPRATDRCPSRSRSTRPASADGLAAGDLAKSFLPVIEGRGGGKKDLAQGAGTRPDRVPEAIDALRAAVLAQAG